MWQVLWEKKEVLSQVTGPEAAAEKRERVTH